MTIGALKELHKVFSLCSCPEVSSASMFNKKGIYIYIVKIFLFTNHENLDKLVIAWFI